MIRAVQDSDDQFEPKLYLHLFTPPNHLDPHMQPIHVMTTRVYLSHDSDGSSCARVQGGGRLVGRIERRGEKFIGHLGGSSGGGIYFFDGDMDLEKPVEPQSGMSASGVGESVRFVLSTNSYCGSFLK